MTSPALNGQTLDVYLGTFRKAWKPAYDRRAAALPPAQAQQLAFLRADTGTGYNPNHLAERLTFLKEQLAAPSPQRTALLEVLFPQIADTVERAVDTFLTRHTYTQGYTRRAFRAPGQPQQAERAAAWVWTLWSLTREYPQDVEWFAVHAGLLGWQADHLGWLLAQAIDDGNEAVFEVLAQTAATQHPVARMGRHVTRAWLVSARPDAWALAEGLLLAAQRQEGLRQVILESIDEAHPDAFVRMLHLILKEDLLRFAATVRAADVWFGLNYDVTDLKRLRPLLIQASGFLDDPAQARAAVATGSGQEAFLAFYTLAMRNAPEAAALALGLLQPTPDPDPERRMAAARFLLDSDLYPSAELLFLLDDPELRIGAMYLSQHGYTTDPIDAKFERIEAYALRLSDAPKSASPDATHTPLLFPWLGHLPSRVDVLDSLPRHLGTRPIGVLLAHLPAMSGSGRGAVLGAIGERALDGREVDGKIVATTPVVLDAHSRAAIFTLLQDRSSALSQEAVSLIDRLLKHGLTLEEGETLELDALLKRKGADLRRGVLKLLGRDPAQARASALRLLASRTGEQRQAGLQLLLLHGQATDLPAEFVPRGQAEESLHAALITPDAALTLKDGLGLFDPAQRTQPRPVAARPRPYTAVLARGAELLTALDELAHTHRETPVTGEGWDGEEVRLLGNLGYWYGEQFPLPDLWLTFWQNRENPQDDDVTALMWAVRRHRTPAGAAAPEEPEDLDLEALLEEDEQDADDTDDIDDELDDGETEKLALTDQILESMFGPPVMLPAPLRYASLVQRMLPLLARQATPADVDLALDVWETQLAMIPTDAELQPNRYGWRGDDPRDGLHSPHFLPLSCWTLPQRERLWWLSLYQNQAFPKLARRRPDTALLLEAYAQGWANHTDLLDALIGDPGEREGYSSYNNFSELRRYSGRKPDERLPTHPDWVAAVNTVRERVLAVELERGDLETAASTPALALGWVSGAAYALRALAALGKEPLRRGYTGSNESRPNVLSHLIRVSFPAATDTPESFAAAVKAHGIPEGRLLDLAMFAPQWARLVAAALGWKGLEGGVYWLHAHTRDTSWSVAQDVREAWEAEISERTPLTPQELLDGAVDVAWFRQMYAELGAARFASLLDAAKYASSSGGHKRAERFARALLGELPEEELTGAIAAKRQQDSVRALGLLPLSRGKQKGAAQLEGRYRVLSDFRHSARQFGAQRQASERLAADIGMQNLARTAGYADPQRLRWAMEARLAPDWTRQADVEGVQVGLNLTAQGEASLWVRRGEKPLKNVPAALTKHPEIVAIKATLTELSATRGRMRAALEEAMVRGDLFTPQELAQLGQHPVIAPLLRALVWVQNEAVLGWWQGQELQTLEGPQPTADLALRIAHPHDLFACGQWRQWQAQVIEHGIQQPFKQVFREYYPLTPAEQGAKRSARYTGHHVQPSQALALLKARGWVAVHEEGIRKTFHAEGINVWLDTSLAYTTPGEVEGTPLDGAYFTSRESGEVLALASVPPRLFSETMRDLDLVVSVAHVGGVDPEASQSTTEMRAALVGETVRLLRLDNVRLQDQHALIDGAFARYSVHLGSGNVHLLPGGALCVVPVHNQQQGRIFLPFADPDPRTAEVVSKVLLFARDREIQDPTILEQLR
ncbi:DUF4132 domain-containing protein [Deinococcus aquatilis]|uniref:DUF4132 domain-containing protein n=1 Tax=Deinococcus aquatilis TaxID=519440 RepID=UPI000368D6DE|nr:DUF4132 domain-containing protein [Deinococcus aquatilis]